MFVGHLAVALMAKRAAPAANLGWLMAGVTALDLVRADWLDHRSVGRAGRIGRQLAALEHDDGRRVFYDRTQEILRTEGVKRMPRYVIERELPGVGDLSDEQLQEISKTSCGVLNVLGPQIQWVESFVTGNRIYCVYIAPNEEMIREHGRQGGFPVTRVSEVKAVIDPTTAERTPGRLPG